MAAARIMCYFELKSIRRENVFGNDPYLEIVERFLCSFPLNLVYTVCLDSGAGLQFDLLPCGTDQTVPQNQNIAGGICIDSRGNGIENEQDNSNSLGTSLPIRIPTRVRHYATQQSSDEQVC